MPASLLVEQRKMIFYNKTLQNNNIVLRILCSLHRNEAKKLSSMYHIFLGHSSSIDIKRAVWSSFVRVQLLVLSLLIFVFLYSYTVMFSCCLFCSSLFLYVFIVYWFFCIFYFCAALYGVINNDYKFCILTQNKCGIYTHKATQFTDV